MIDPPAQTDPQADPAPPARPLRVALAHDWLVGYRGGEMVLDAIARLLLEDHHDITRLYTMFDAGQALSPPIDALDHDVSSLNTLPPQLRRWLLMRYPAAVRQLSRRLARDHAAQPIDLLISTHSAAIKAIEPPPTTTGRPIPHLCYCHSPARYLWSQTEQYRSPDLKGRLRSLGLRAFAPALRRWDKQTAGVTRFIANSHHTAAEIDRCYHRDSTVVHPPVRTEFFTPSDQPRGESLLLVSALEPYKRVELAIDAACLVRRPLTIVGSGSHESALRAHARRAQKHHDLPNHIAFAGRVDDQTLRSHYRRARAFLFPQIEDFGITAVEAQATGCPVVARRAGGALDSVIEHETGAFFDAPRAESIANTIDRCPRDPRTTRRCRDNALRFSEAVFQEKMRAQISLVLR